MTQVRFLYASRINNKMTKKTKEAIAMYNAIFLRRANKVTTPESTSGFADTALIATLLKNLESLGYVLSKDVIVELLMTSNENVISFASEITTALKELLGDNVTHRPMYPNFPRQVMEASSAELYINALLHYFGSAIGLTILPVYTKEDRPALTHTKPLTVISRGTEVEFSSLMKSLSESKISFSEQDRKDLAAAIEALPYSNSIQNKENLAFLSTLDISYTTQFKTATDVLRYIVALSGGDISLAEKTKFKKFKKAERRQILDLLESLDNGLTEDMLRYKSEWKRVGEILHPGEYAKRFPKVARSFNIIRNDLPFETFNSKTERLIKEGDAAEAALHLAERPGEFARRLDKLLQLASNKLGLSQVIINQFNSIAPKVSSSVLLQTRAHFLNRSNTDSLRVFFPKGNISKFAAIEDKRGFVEARHSLAVVEACTRALATIYKERELEPLGKVFIDPELRGYLIPFGNRSASANKHTLARGTRMAIPEGDTLRFFTHWKNIDSMDSWGGRVDIDLSAGMLDENFKTKGVLAYYNLRDVNGVHSGDITDAPDGASEFIDVSIKKALSSGIRYIYMSILSYSRQSFDEIPELFAGFMIRTAPGSGEIYDPRTVENKVDITVSSTNAVPFIIDLENREVIWTDMSMPSASYRPNNVASNKNGLELLSEALVTRKGPTMYDLFSIHAESRGVPVDNREDADTVFALDGDVTPFDAEIILSEYV